MSASVRPASSSTSFTMRASRARPCRSSSPVGDTASVTPTIAAFPLSVLTFPLNPRSLPELEPGEVAGGAPLLEVLEVGHRSGRVAEEPVDAAALALVVVVAGGAVDGADGAHARTRVEQFHPLVLGGLGDFDLSVAAVDGVLQRRRHRHTGLGEVVRHVRDEVG